MRTLAALVLAVPLAAGLPAVSPPTSQNGVVHLPLRKVVDTHNAIMGSRRLFRNMPRRARAGDGLPHQTLIDRSEYYIAELGIGTPPQPVRLLVDTGGWVTWVNPMCEYAQRKEDCDGVVPYNPSASNPSPRHVHELDQIVQYGDTSGAAIEGYADVFTWDNESRVPDQPFGVANQTIGLNTGILGMAPDGRLGFDSPTSNMSAVSVMANQGIIASRVFSLAFGHTVQKGQADGTLVFGGVDRNRFRGRLAQTAIVPRSQATDGWRHWTTVTQVKHTLPGGKVGTVNNVPKGTPFNGTYLLDSGTTGIYVMHDTYKAILAEANMTRNDLRYEGFPEIDCNTRNLTGKLSFTFPDATAANASFTIDVPYASLVHPQVNLITGDSSKCYFGLSSAGNDYEDGDIFPILGSEFVRAWTCGIVLSRQRC